VADFDSFPRRRSSDLRLAAAWADAFHVCFNGGKQSIAVDLGTEAGRAALYAWIADQRPDVVVHNFRPGVAERLGLDEPQLRALRSEEHTSELQSRENL